MGPSVSLFLLRAAGVLLAGMLLFGLLGHARADGYDNYGLKRFPGDNYDTIPPGGAVAPVAASPAPSGAASSSVPAGYYPALNPGSAPQAGTPKADASQPGATQPGATQDIRSAAPAMPTLPAQRTAAIDPHAAGAAAQNQPQANPDYVLGAGDKLRLTVFDETDLSGEYTIDGSGFARLPLIGQVRAAGYTAPQLERVIAAALGQGYLKSPRVSVEVTTYRPFYIIGAVNRPGEYPYVNHMNALNAVALAGGYAPSAVESVIYVRREGSNRELRLPADRSTQIYPGDVVRVNTTIFWDAMNLLSPLASPLSIAAAAAIP